MDKITSDLLASGIVLNAQVDRVLEAGSSHPLRDLTVSGFITTTRLNSFIVEKIKEGKYHPSILDSYDYIDEEEILSCLAHSQNLPFIDLDSIDLDYSLIQKVPLSHLKKYTAIPVFEDPLSISIALRDPLDIQAKESIQRLFINKPIKLAVATKAQIESYLLKVELQDSIKGLIKKIKDELSSPNSHKEESSSILLLIDTLLAVCIKNRASDVHIEPTEKNCVVRTRIDGKLVEIFILEKEIYPPLASRLKLLSNLDIAERRKPQDGRFSTIIELQKYDFRISTLPILYGESIVIRVLDRQNVVVKLEDSGMDPLNYQKFLKALKTPYGIILVTGPTGSGKTTTLYGALNELRNIEDKIITIEDPIEYRMNLIQQVQVNPKVGLTFATALRSILRQDPDKIMIGEIRDSETLEIAIKAALTGHLVLSTLHTNSSISAINRMVDMGIAPYLISGSLVAIQAQRLVRKICIKCRVEDLLQISLVEEIKHLVQKGSKFYIGRGCKECNGTGYFGREMICEVLVINEEISSLIAKGASTQNIHAQAVEDGFVGLFENGIDKALSGITSLEEVLRVAK
jgi:general secretion pathway protein E